MPYILKKRTTYNLYYMYVGRYLYYFQLNILLNALIKLRDVNIYLMYKNICINHDGSGGVQLNQK